MKLLVKNIMRNIATCYIVRVYVGGIYVRNILGWLLKRIDSHGFHYLMGNGGWLGSWYVQYIQ